MAVWPFLPVSFYSFFIAVDIDVGVSTLVISILHVWDPIMANVRNLQYTLPNVNYIQDERSHIHRKHFVNNFQCIIFWPPLFNLCQWASYPMTFIVIFPNIPSSLPMAYLSSYTGYFREPHWKSMGLSEIPWVTLQAYNGFLDSLKFIKNITCISM